jgi:hypothetical protein
MITVSSGDTELAGREGFLEGDSDLDGAGLTEVAVCAQLAGHWQKTPVARRRADKQITGFTAGRLFKKLRDLRQLRFWVQLYI